MAVTPCAPCTPCTTCEPEPCAPKPKAPPAPPIKARIKLDCGAAGVSFPAALCGCAGLPAIEGIDALVRRRGQECWQLKYPAWELTEGGRVAFRFDALFAALTPGRYELQLRKDETPCGSVELDLRAACPADVASPEVVRASSVKWPKAPSGVHPVYADYVGWSAELCTILEKGSSVLPLCQEGITQLCGKTACKPVELVLSDGVSTEIVAYLGCVGGVPQIDRPNPNKRFPMGSIVSFEWTNANATNALTPVSYTHLTLPTM
jgi:hypothetical protein